jgi:hypothetical protein
VFAYQFAVSLGRFINPTVARYTIADFEKQTSQPFQEKSGIPNNTYAIGI